ncbi:MAG: phenylalanine--tRNA ligase subunit alpha [Alphaproteobacteria bacterium]
MGTLLELQNTSLAAIAAAGTLDALDEVRVSLLGKKGTIALELQKLGTLAPEERKAYGAEVNVVKDAVQTALTARKTVLEEASLNAKLAAETVDVTLPPAVHHTGKIHPISATMEEVGTILARLGFSHATGPQVETDYYNFTALNIPADHPARQDHDTFYVQPDATGVRKVLRTQTSNVQIHTMLAHKPPLRIMSIGRVYRRDSDLTHTPQFHQVEGLAVEEGLTFGHLKGTLQKFLNDFFETNATMRLRPHYFPFTEPSAEVDLQCLFCKGQGCRVCKSTGWLEVLGAGMVHRNVLREGNIDFNTFQGFAFGCGIERLAMLKYGINDLRMFYESHTAFLEHYGKSAARVAG